jgi:alginate O-acetyltransferase complex protein AlgI
MPFNSLAYCFFLPAVFLLVSLSRGRLHWLVLLVSSLLFYAALGVPYLLWALVVVTGVSYAGGIAIGRARSAGGKRALLVAGILANLSVLLLLKYLPFTGEILKAFHPLMPAALPDSAPSVVVSVGVSYYVFQAISYLADIYLEVETAERHLGYFALYMAFFPKLLQGPIERCGALLPQLREPLHLDYENVRAGLVLFAWGLWKKLVIADRLAPVVDAAYGDVHGYSGISLLFATYCYAIQIYCDFSGYTDMARGTALLFNVKLTENFNAPYAATSIADFWRRWHISFSRWILDYIFKPLQMLWRSHATAGTVAALLVTFVISGIWHGASWGFVVWGGLHGFYMGCSVLYKPYKKKIHRVLGMGQGGVAKAWQTLVTFHLVCFAWIFFRAASLPDAWHVVHSLQELPGGKLEVPQFLKLIDIFGRNDLLIAVTAVGLLLTVGWLRDKVQLFSWPPYLRWPCYLALVFMIVLLSTFHSSSEFIYVQF